MIRLERNFRDGFCDDGFHKVDFIDKPSFSKLL
jgi:hypothetical protein